MISILFLAVSLPAKHRKISAWQHGPWENRTHQEQVLVCQTWFVGSAQREFILSFDSFIENYILNVHLLCTCINTIQGSAWLSSMRELSKCQSLCMVQCQNSVANPELFANSQRLIWYLIVVFFFSIWIIGSWWEIKELVDEPDIKSRGRTAQQSS